MFLIFFDRRYRVGSGGKDRVMICVVVSREKQVKLKIPYGATVVVEEVALYRGC